jgi:hypothetical protein
MPKDRSEGAVAKQLSIRLPDTGLVTDRVQFREDEDVLAYVASLGLNPNEVARRAFEREVRRLRADEKVKKLRAFKIRLAPGEAVRLVREDRDSH